MNAKGLLFFIRKSLFFLAGFLILVYFLDMVINFTVKKIDVGEYGVLNRINEGEINADILINGSSRALKAINPQILTDESGMSCFNLASDGSDLGVQLPKLKWYLNHNKKPKILIQDVSQFGGEISNTIYEPFKYLPYLSDNSLYNGLLQVDKKFWIHKYLYPSNLLYYNFDFYAKLFQELILTINNEDNLINGFLPDNSNWSSNFEQYIKENSDSINCSVSNEYENHLIELKKFCEEHKIILLFTVIPTYYKLNEITKNAEFISDFYSQLQKIPCTYYLDFLSISSIASEEENFYNFTHLNVNGANRFSKILADHLLQILE